MAEVQGEYPGILVHSTRLLTANRPEAGGLWVRQQLLDRGWMDEFTLSCELFIRPPNCSELIRTPSAEDQPAHCPVPGVVQSFPDP